MNKTIYSIAAERKLKNLREQVEKYRLDNKDLREQVLALVPVLDSIRETGISLIPSDIARSARERILYYFKQYPLLLIDGKEISIISGISEWARRVRELRVQFGWKIYNGDTIREMMISGDLEILGVQLNELHPDNYIMISTEEDRLAAHRWNIANTIRKEKVGVKLKLLKFFQENIGEEITGEELRYVANTASEWARRIRELRTEEGWPIVTKSTGRPDLPVGVYILESNRQSEVHDRLIADDIRVEVLSRDSYKCTSCGWNRDSWVKGDPRQQLELHHVKFHVEGGANTTENLITVCNVCHDNIHRFAHESKK